MYHLKDHATMHPRKDCVGRLDAPNAFFDGQVAGFDEGAIGMATRGMSHVLEGVAIGVMPSFKDWRPDAENHRRGGDVSFLHEEYETALAKWASRHFRRCRGSINFYGGMRMYTEYLFLRNIEILTASRVRLLAAIGRSGKKYW